MEQGKTITEARGEIAGTAGFFDYYASFERAQVGAMFAPDGTGEQLFVKSVPYGVVAAITPWNFPAAIFARKVAPAIMAGNAIVLKPHENTPLTALAIARIVEEAGVPDGVVNVVTGAGRTIGDALVRHPFTQMVTVTGSVRAGKEILAAAAENITPVSLELGGKAPFIVLEDADLDAAVENAVNARFWNCGQVCTCNERTYVHRALYDEFVERFVERARTLRMGDPMRDDSQMGPKVSEEELVKVESFVRGAVEGGAAAERPQRFEGGARRGAAGDVREEVPVGAAPAEGEGLPGGELGWEEAGGRGVAEEGVAQGVGGGQRPHPALDVLRQREPDPQLAVAEHGHLGLPHEQPAACLVVRPAEDVAEERDMAGAPLSGVLQGALKGAQVAVRVGE
jgi:hypothetical protein